MSDNKSTGTQVSSPLTRSAVKAQDFDFRGAVKRIREANGSIASQSGNLMWDAALVLGEALDRNLVGNKDGAMFATQGQYAAAAGYKDSTGTLLKRLSIAQGHGITRASKEWTFLVSEGTVGRVGDAVKSATDGKDLKARLAPLMSEKASTGKVASKATAPGEGATKTAAEKEADKAPTAPVVPTVKDVLVALHAVQPAIHGFTDAQWVEVKEAMVKAIKSEDHRRDLLAKRAATNGKATPATVAKAAAKRATADKAA